MKDNYILGNTALKGMITDFGPEFASKALLNSPSELIAMAAHYEQKADIATTPKEKGIYMARAAKANAVIDSLLDISCEALGVKVDLIVAEQLLKGNPTKEEMQAVSEMVIEAGKNTKGVTIIEAANEEGKGKVIAFTPSSTQTVNEEVKQVLEPELPFQEQSTSTSETTDTGAPEATAPKKEKRVLTISRVPSLGTNPAYPVHVISAITAINDLDRYFRDIVPNLGQSREANINAYIDAVLGAEGFTDLPQDSLTRMKMLDNLGSIEGRYINMVENFKAKSIKAPAKERMFFNDVLTEIAAIMATGDLAKAEAHANQRFKVEGTLTAEGKVRPHMSTIVYNKLMEDLKTQHYVESITPAAETKEEHIAAAIEAVKTYSPKANAVEYAKTPHTYEELVSHLCKLIQANNKQEAYYTAEEVLNGKSIKHADGKDSDFFTIEKTAALVNYLIRPSNGDSAPSQQKKKAVKKAIETTVQATESTEEITSSAKAIVEIENERQAKALEIIAANPIIEQKFEEAIKANGGKRLEMSAVSGVLKTITGVWDSLKNDAGIKSRIYRYCKAKFTAEAKPLVEATTDIKAEAAAEMQDEIFVKSNTINQAVADGLKGSTDLEQLEVAAVALLTNGATWQDVLNGLYQAIKHVTDEVAANWTDNTIDMWFNSVVSERYEAAKKATFDAPAQKIEDAVIVEETTEQVAAPITTVEQISAALTKAKDQKSLNVTIKALMAEGKQEEAVQHAELFFPQKSKDIGWIKNYVEKIGKK